MKLITAYPVIMNGKVVANKNAADTLNFSSAAGDNVFNMANPFAPSKPSASPLFNTNLPPKTGSGAFNFPKPTTFGTPNTNPTPAQVNDPANKGKVWDKAKGIFVKAKELGLLDGLLNRIGLGGATGGDTGITTQEPPPQEDGGGNTTKILLIAGGALVLITVIILATKSKGK